MAHDYFFADCETASAVNLKQSTHRAYCAHPSTRVLFWGVGHPNRDLPTRIVDELSCYHLTSVTVTWGSFDEAVYRGVERGPARRRFFDAMQLALFAGLPVNLDDCARALGLDVRKDPRGAKLIALFSRPPFADPAERREDWLAFQQYCAQDVEVLRAVFERLKPLVPDWQRHQQKNLELVERMNDRGAPIDSRSARRAIERVDAALPELVEECKKLTGGIEPTQVAKLAEWLGVPNLQRINVEEWATDTLTFSEVQRRVLQIRLETNFPSNGKLWRMLQLRSDDDRVRDQFVNNGAHTGRATSRGIQLHNMKKGEIEPAYFDALASGAPLSDVPERTSLNMRGFIQAPPGRRLLVFDYAQIECRVLAWLAGEEKLLNAFRRGYDVYRMMGANIFGIDDWRTLEKDSLERGRGKITVLGCGYQLGWRGLIRNAKTQWGVVIVEEDAQKAVAAFRGTFDRIVEFWYELNDAAITAAKTGETAWARAIRFDLERLPYGLTFLKVTLPSGRPIRYLNPEVVFVTYTVEHVNPETGEIERKVRQREAVRFMSRGPGNAVMVPDHLYGGKLAENVTQAIAADILLDGVRNAEAAGLGPIMTVHDEVVGEVDEAFADEGCALMKEALCTLPAWAEGIPIEAEGWHDTRYHK